MLELERARPSEGGQDISHRRAGQVIEESQDGVLVLAWDRDIEGAPLWTHRESQKALSRPRAWPGAR